MPIIKSAIKKLRKDKKRTKLNRAKKEKARELIKKAKKSPTATNVKAAIRMIDKLTKVHLLHKNKAARLKSRLAKLVKPVKPSTRTKGPTKGKTNLSGSSLQIAQKSLH